MKDVKLLSLVLMKSLNLNIEDRVRIYIDTIVFLDVLSQTNLVLVLNVHELLLSLLVCCVLLQTFKYRKICDPAVADLLCSPVSKQWVCMEKESSLCNTVCLVVELLRTHLVEITKLTLLQDFCMKFSNTVYGVRSGDSKVSHLNLTIIEDSHAANLILVARIHIFNLKNESTVDLIYDLIYSRKKLLEEVDWPLLKCLSHDCMVCICACSASDIPSIIPLKILLINKDSHKLCYCYSWMCIVQLECNLVWKIMDICVVLLELQDCSLYRSGYEEVLLL